MPRAEMPEGHRVVLTFEDGVYWRLIHPEKGCEPALSCSCQEELEGRDRCPGCGQEVSKECWLTGWFDNLEPEDLLRGEIELPIDAEWDGDYPIIHINHSKLHAHWLEQLKEELLSKEQIHSLTQEIVEGSDGEVISLPYRTVEDALRQRLDSLEGFGD